MDGEKLAITVWSYGATLVEVRVPDRDGRSANVVVRLPDLTAYEQVRGRAYLGATMGRYARCIAGGRVTIDGKSFELTRNIGGHHLHGGRFGFDSFVWEEAGVECTPERVAVRMRLVRPDGDEGYPGELTAHTTYALERGGTLVFEHMATTTAPTLCDLTNHTMWNLGGGGTIDGHLLWVNAHHVLLVDKELIPVDAPIAVERGKFDLREGVTLEGRTLDNCFVLEDPSWAACLVDPASGRRMMVSTDQPGLQIYSAHNFQISRAGVCLQTGSWPNAPVQAAYPSARLDPEKVYRHRTEHRFDIIDDIEVLRLSAPGPMVPPRS
jgi:aldose 1-epimerase